MNSGTFHISSQEWRYFSREKSIVHTTHLAQIPSSRAGDTVLIANTAPTQNQTSKTGKSQMQVPPAPYFQTNIFNVTNDSFVISSYGCVNYNGQILAQKNMGISVGSVGGSLAQVTMVPEESGFFVVHVEANSDLHTFGYEGTDGEITVQVLVGSAIMSEAKCRLKMEGPLWDGVHNYMMSMPRAIAECLVPASSFTGLAYNIGSNTNGARFGMWAYKVADYG
jgi:hypothetical protein